MAFADLYPLTAFAAIADVSWWRTSDMDSKRDEPKATREQRDAAHALDTADKARLEAHQEAVYTPAVRAHLEALREAGALRPTGGIKGRDCWPANAWNSFVAGDEPTHHTGWLIDRIADGAFTMTFVRMDDMRRHDGRELGVHVPPTEAQVRAAWEKICSDLDGGTAGENFDGWRIEATDSNTGDRCELAFRSWEGVLMRRNAQHRLEPARDVEALPLVAVPISVPTGQLLITDAMRIDAFNDATDLGDAEYREASLESEKGCMRRTEMYAERFDVGFCQTTNTTISVHVSDADGSIVFLPRDDITMPGWTAIKGDLDCGVWSIMAMDRQTAETLLTTGGSADAADELDRAIAYEGDPDEDGDDLRQIMAGHTSGTYLNNILRLDVKPGTWIMHSGHDFDERVDHAAFGLPADVRPWALLQSPRS